ncbi:hypothetical protein C8Q75DRAFT_809056 [Abortiporus biennis]|nr:hypothetical protein C8Q75DRAFT_809056 [Abortiporus biennis]
MVSSSLKPGALLAGQVLPFSHSHFYFQPLHKSLSHQFLDMISIRSTFFSFLLCIFAVNVASLPTGTLESRALGVLTNIVHAVAPAIKNPLAPESGADHFYTFVDTTTHKVKTFTQPTEAFKSIPEETWRRAGLFRTTPPISYAQMATAGAVYGSQNAQAMAHVRQWLGSQLGPQALHNVEVRPIKLIPDQFKPNGIYRFNIEGDEDFDLYRYFKSKNHPGAQPYHPTVRDTPTRQQELVTPKSFYNLPVIVLPITAEQVPLFCIRSPIAVHIISQMRVAA